jgi:lipopolysaccharide export system protein LptA
VTVINAKKHLLLDSKGYQATFQGDVTVVDPRFSLSCDKLVAYLKRPSNGEKEQGGEKPQAAGEQVPKPAAGDGAAGQGGVEKAVAEGDVIIVQDKVNDKGESERSIARARKAVYDSLTGNITLSGMPQVEQRGNTIVAAEESTVMILNSKGSMEVLGQSKSVLRNTSTENGR